jgi:hypothetical protein
MNMQMNHIRTMGKCYDIPQGPAVMRSALRAIIARIDGNWTQKDLVEYGPLSSDTFLDVKTIAIAALITDSLDGEEDE